MVRRRPTLRLLVLPLAALLAAPAQASALNGGASAGAIVLPGTPPTVVQLGNPLVSGSAGAGTISARATALVRGRVRVSGRVATPAPAGVRVERLDARGRWVAVATVPVATDGSFHALWRPTRPGATQLRALVLRAGGKGAAAGAHRAARGGGVGAAGADAEATDGAGAPRVSVTVYRPETASWYGPGRGRAMTACGVPLRRETLGVAHRTLPCGSRVALYYRGRTLVVPVIDRGPFVKGRAWDLTLATYQALGGGSAGLLTLGALPLPDAA